MTFKNYLNSQTFNIRINNLQRVSGVDIISSDDEYYFETNYTKHFVLRKIDNSYKLFNSFIELGKKLYKFNKDKVIYFEKIDANYQVYNINFENFLITRHNYNNETKEYIKKWLEENYYFVEQDADLTNKKLIETDFLIDLSIFSYLVSQATKTFYNGLHHEKERKKSIGFETFLILPPNSDTNYIKLINELMYQFQQRNFRLIREETEVVYENFSSQLLLIKVFENLYSLMWYILKLYLVYTSTLEGDAYPRLCNCGNSLDGKSVRCEMCKQKYNNERRRINRDNQEMIHKINDLNMQYKLSSDLQTKIKNLQNKKCKFTDHDNIKNLLNSIEQYISLE